jgi:hypothetical protein
VHGHKLSVLALTSLNRRLPAWQRNAMHRPRVAVKNTSKARRYTGG